MDDLLREFLTETNESLDVVDVELVKFEQDPNNEDILSNIFRLVHTVKGTCGFLGLPRLEALAHAAETLMGKYRDGMPVQDNGVTVILHSIDRIKEILSDLEANETEPEGTDEDLIDQLVALSEGDAAAPVEAISSEEVQDAPAEASANQPDQELDASGAAVRPGEVSLDELEAAFQAAEGPNVSDPLPASKAEEAKPQPAAKAASPAKAADTSNDVVEDSVRKESAVANQSIRVNVDTLEDLMTMVSELVLTRNQLMEMVRRLDDSEFKVPLQRLSGVTGELQEAVMKTRMQPIGNAWQKLPRIVRDLGKELDKKIELEMLGAETELDRQVLDLIKDPLTHMVRNSADHGLETTAEREAAGKPTTGKVTLRAYHEGGHIIIEVSDDGKGLDVEKIKAKVLANGLVSEAEIEKMTEQQIHRFIFNAGFSTAAQVTSVSGRGVGMDVVRTNIELIGGSIDLRSTMGKGTSFVIKIPLTLAIVSALIVESAGEKFAIPQLAVVELVRAKGETDHRIEQINQTPVLRLRNRLLPLVFLGDLLSIKDRKKVTQTDQAEQVKADDDAISSAPASGEEGEVTGAHDEAFIVVTRVGDQTFGIVVDSVFDTEEIVVKPVATILRNIPIFSGNTILGDGSVIMIIDPNGIVQSISSELTENDAATTEDEAAADGSDDRMSLLVFRAGGEEPKAVPLSLVTRLEEFDISVLEKSSGRDVTQYRGTLMPIIHVAEGTPLKTEGRQPVLVFTDENRAMGLAVDEIVDIVSDRLNVEIGSERLGMLGLAVIKGEATEVLDVGYYLTRGFSDWFERRDGGSQGKERRLLLVDDSPFFRNMMSPLLNAAGYKVTEAETAEDALKLREAGNAFDVIVSDIEMPGMDGFAFAEEIRKDDRWANIPIVALSAHGTPRDVDRGREAGFHDYVAKFDRDGLVEVLNETLEIKGEVAA